ncbi:hypothetical protein SMD22_00610 (plasmid) [Brevibacillus halotolerans]|nr:hypothetical protein SMD22_00610 [Brevibacillus halotolerans]
MFSELLQLISEEKKNERAHMNIQQDIFRNFGDTFYNEDQSKIFSFCGSRLLPDKKVIKLHIQLTLTPTVDQIEFYKERYQKEWENRDMDREGFLHTCFHQVEKEVARFFSYSSKIKNDIAFIEKEGKVKKVDIHSYIEIKLTGNLIIVLSKQIQRSLEDLKEFYLKSPWDQ